MGVILPKKASELRKRERNIAPVRSTRKMRTGYFDSLKRAIDILRASTGVLSDVISSGAERATVIGKLGQLARETQARIEAMAPSIARIFVDDVDKANKAATEASIKKALGVDFAIIENTPELANEIEQALQRNTSLIKSIGREHWDKVGEAVYDNYRGVALPDGLSLEKRLRQLPKITETRAKIIARDQTSKLTGDINQARQRSIGVTEYEWVTSDDQRVVGTPGGKYPKGSKAHGNHYERNGKRFKWSEPPPDGHPGQAILCRCNAKPVLNLDALEAKYV